MMNKWANYVWYLVPQIEKERRLSLIKRDYWNYGQAIKVLLPDQTKRAGEVIKLPL